MPKAQSPLDRARLSVIAGEWLASYYDAFPRGIRGLGVRSFEAVPTVVLADPVDTSLFTAVLTDAGYDVAVKSTDRDHSVIAARTLRTGTVRHTFDTSPQLGLDSPRRYETPPTDGKTQLIATYLDRRYG